MLNGTVSRLYEKWFLQPIPPNNRPLEMPMSAVLRDQIRDAQQQMAGLGQSQQQLAGEVRAFFRDLI